MLFVPFAWIGFDYPQYRTPLLEAEKIELKKVAEQMEKRLGTIRQYLSSEHSHLFLTEHQSSKLWERIELMIQVLKSKEYTTIEDLHLLYLPDYTQVAKMVCKYYYYWGTMHTVFRLQWRPQQMLDRLPKNQQDQLLDDISSFIHSKD